ncbi:gamma-glutamyl kinase [Candidatus Methylomirabilis lanthanidiphila]|uniref:Glutamate 5-kinase n=1 Tax=Candidatus Methylomirabilis lanthanidiphila TaxID=2211376 RepID=A0A564ZI21_9BACT|nr:gamma-glutamyl kinase [Candidatus Methylomirabilis lanthanidiphila]
MSQAERSLPDARAVARETKRIVVKVGSAVLSKGDITLHQPTLQRICRELVSLRKEGHQVVLVSSGAILAGMGRLGLTERPGSIPLKQAAAAVGQSLLMRRYEEVFAPYGQKLGQLLLTQDDFRSRHRYLNARNTLFTLLHLGVLPIINENDTVAVEEIRFGDNDRLSALVATLLGADLLVILTDLDGLYTADPRKDPHARLVHEVPRRSTGLHFWADESGTGLGTGGMATKVRAARTAAAAGVPTIIANGLVEGILERIIRGETVGTVFQASASRMRSRKRWLAFATTRRGRIMVDAGAKEALIRNGKSLLPSGVISVDGEFEGGDVVSLCSIDGVEFARGVTNYNAEQVKQIRGIRSDQIEDALGEKPFDEVVHRDNLVILA